MLSISPPTASPDKHAFGSLAWVVMYLQFTFANMDVRKDEKLRISFLELSDPPDLLVRGVRNMLKYGIKA